MPPQLTLTPETQCSLSSHIKLRRNQAAYFERDTAQPVFLGEGRPKHTFTGSFMAGQHRHWCVPRDVSLRDIQGRPLSCDHPAQGEMFHSSDITFSADLHVLTEVQSRAVVQDLLIGYLRP